jgi:branched-subunit amino acid ABC-type transport system permease component
VLLTAFATLLAMSLLALAGARLLVLAGLAALVVFVIGGIAALLLTDVRGFVIGVTPLLLVCHHEFSCEAAAFSISVQRR